MTALAPRDRALLNRLQRDIPLDSRPFAAIAAELDMTEQAVIERLRQLDSEGAISRLGAVFEPNIVGVSTLAALAVPPERVESTAALVNTMPGVNHNYLREHDYNLWFVMVGKNREELDRRLAAIEEATGLPLLDLPLEQAYHIDLGFPL